MGGLIRAAKIHGACAIVSAPSASPRRCEAAGKTLRQNCEGCFDPAMPDPVPVAVLGRLAVERTFQRHGPGRALMRDAAKRVVQAADIIGIRGILVRAISPQAKAFYLAFGFEASPLQPLTLMATLADIQATVANRGA
jgi:GNAT superfamily N-acetyltransferase